MGREPALGLSRRAVADTELVAARLGEDLLMATPVVGDRGTQRVLDAAIDALADALRMVSAQAGYVRAGWPEPRPERRASERVWESR
ncbi:MAG: hypothetical protein V9G19_14605 [Tetrasphaera sp.]